MGELVKRISVFFSICVISICLHVNTETEAKVVSNEQTTQSLIESPLINVAELMLRLERAGFKVSGTSTDESNQNIKQAIKNFQSQYGLTPTGIADQETLEKLEDVIHNRVARHLPAIVNPNGVYTYQQMQEDMKRLEFMYPNLIESKVIGQSVAGRAIYAIKLGNGKKEVYIDAAHHGREHMTTNLVMNMVDTYARAYAADQTFATYDVKELLDQVTIWIIPMVNPDGVTLAQHGLKTTVNPGQLILYNNGRTDFKNWKANLHGVDLNRQYPFQWNTIVHDPGKPSYGYYKGQQALSEPEAKAVYRFIKSHHFLAAISYHSSGQLVYGRSGHDRYTLPLQKQIADATGYRPIDLHKNPDGGGLTSWFVYDQGQPGITPEISPYVVEQPVPLKNWDNVWNRNKTIGLLVAKHVINR
ncbi:M14 family zinc carboxypeptidase [Aquibacillus sediminis]|uniref:M14 family zinc carboxypeptidase n=1 Tax=Aquibacillus sediminis TaxID=2574734 RepID=UPI0011086579|nr:M14 family zinc carboxypeptidase [Aquibacillus sediminis]